MKRTLLPIIATFGIFCHSIFPQSNANANAFSQAQNSAADYSKAAVSIKFYDRTMYYPGSAADNPIYVHVTIKNNGAETLRFKLADDRMFSTDFSAFTVRNTQLDHTPELIRKRTTNQTVYFREIALETGEEYSFVENAKDFLNFSEPSVYYIELTFYPELYKSKYIELKSNRLTLEVRPSPSAASSSIIPVSAGTAQVLQPEQISPDKVVEQTIIARQKSLWDQYFLYMDLEEMLKRDPLRKSKYTASSAEDGERMISDYKAALMAEKIDGDIVATPEKFEIVRTNYTRTEGTVTVHEWFKYKNYHEKKEYIYYVRQRDGIWRIYGYGVNNLGTE